MKSSKTKDRKTKKRQNVSLMYVASILRFMSKKTKRQNSPKYKSILLLLYSSPYSYSLLLSVFCLFVFFSGNRLKPATVKGYSKDSSCLCFVFFSRKHLYIN